MQVKHAGLIVALVACLAGFPSYTHAGEDRHLMAVDFLDCSEMAGISLVAYANARPHVPARYTLAGDATNALIVVRAGHCRNVLIDDAPTGSGTVAQVGITIVAPESDGDINNYTLYYDTDSQKLAHHLREAGVNARYVPELAYEISRHRDALAVDVPPPSKARYEVAGSIVPPTSAPVLFIANWWRDTDDGAGGAIKMNTTFPSIHFGMAHMALTPDHHSPLRTLIGGDTLTFPILDSFNTFPSAQMLVDER